MALKKVTAKKTASKASAKKAPAKKAVKPKVIKKSAPKAAPKPEVPLKPVVKPAVKTVVKTVVKTIVPKKKPAKKTPETSRLTKVVQAEIVDDHELATDEGPEAATESNEPAEQFDSEADYSESRPSLLPAKPGTKAVSTTDPIAAYLNEVRRYPLLTREQELELAKKYYDTKDPAAAQALVTANLRFVVKVAAEYSKFGAKLIDLVQEGNMGLMHAVRDFNPYKGVRLITYAVWWIRGYIQEYLLKQYSMVKIATTQNQKRLFYRLQKEKEALDAMGEHPNFALIGERMGIPAEEVEQMANRLSGRDVSLNISLDDSSSSSLMDLQKSGDVGVDDQIGALEELELLREKLAELQDEITGREKIILEERILADDPLTLQEIGEKYGITREAVRQAEVRLMKKIKEKYLGVPENEE